MKLSHAEKREVALADASPRLPTGEPYGLYLFNAEEANRPFTINLASNAIDTYLVVLGPNGRLWEDDDSGDGTGSRLTVTPSNPGAYRIVVSAYRSTERGEYSLKLMDSQRTLDAGGASALAPRPAQPSGGASLRRTGTLQAGDSQLQSGEFVDRYPFNWTAGEQVSIRLNSSRLTLT